MEGTGSPTIHLLVYCERPNQAERYCSLLSLTGLKALVVESEAKFWESISERAVDLILLCTTYPDPPAFQICLKLKEQGSPHQSLPVIVVFPTETPQEVMLQALHLGAYDYLVEPFNEIALLTKTTMLARIKQAEYEYRELAVTDIVTGLYDNRYFVLRAQEELSRAVRYGSPISFITIGVDQLDSIDARFGPGSSNTMLQVASECLRDVKRQIDVLARNANDQFSLVLYNTDRTGALVVANRVLLKLKELDYGLDGYHPQVSIGMTSYNPAVQEQTTAQRLMQDAVDAMQEAASKGGGCIVIHD